MKHCTECHKKFMPQRDWQKFCDAACRKEWYKHLRGRYVSRNILRREVGLEQRNGKRVGR